MTSGGQNSSKLSATGTTPKKGAIVHSLLGVDTSQLPKGSAPMSYGGAEYMDPYKTFENMKAERPVYKVLLRCLSLLYVCVCMCVCVL